MAAITTIRQFVDQHLGETVRILTAEATQPYDGKEGRPDVVGGQIAVALVGLLGASADSGSLSDFARNYVAMDASRRLIPIAINYHLERTGLSDRIASPSRGTALATNETRQQYDRVKALQDLDKLLADQLAADLATFLADTTTVRDPAKHRGPTISTMGQPFQTECPADIGRVQRGRRLVGPGFGGQAWVET
jgi:hypothetical protein